MITSKKNWNKYISALRKVNDKATESILYYLQEFGIPSTQAEMDALIEAAYVISTKYGQAAAALAAQWYDATAVLQGVTVPPALPSDPATISEVAKAVVGTSKIGNEEIIAASVGRLVKMAGVDTTMQNALRDGAEWAWIPVGETCAFCMMLASRGWQYASKKAIKNGHAEHIHANCDCTYTIRFDHFSNVEGYNSDEYLAKYQDADGNTWQEKLRNMRKATYKEYYEEHKDEINEQKRINYAERKEREQ